jgi:hypothetical protein
MHVELDPSECYDDVRIKCSCIQQVSIRENLYALFISTEVTYAVWQLGYEMDGPSLNPLRGADVFFPSKTS